MFIIAGIGLNSYAEEKIKKIILSGADILRYNFSYGSLEQNIENVKLAQSITDELNAGTKIMIDMPLDKIRLGDFDIKIFAVRENEEFIFKTAAYSPDCNEFIPVVIKKLGEKVRVNQTITIGDGEVAIHVIDVIDSETIKARILNNGVIQYAKTFNITERHNEQSTLEYFEKIFDNTKDLQAEYYAISYLGKQINEKIKKLISEKLPKSSRIIIKIENQSGVDDFEKICQDDAYRYILLDRGEMGINIQYEKIGLIQKNLITLAKKYKKTIIVSTQILESTINNYVPYRAEILNLTDMVLEGVGGIMLCQETTVGQRPAYSITVAKKIIAEVEKKLKS